MIMQQMGEAAAAAAPCLMRSVSQPLFPSRGFNEGDRLRALTSSVSFGRFMTEPLDWEKWSSFSHNRTLEDVQKHSRPGAVAEKKAFFEAYYKNFVPKPPKKEYKPLNFSDIDENKPSNRWVVSSDEVVCCLPSTTNLGVSGTGNINDIILSASQVEQEKTSTENVSSPSTNLVSGNSGVKSEISSNKDAYLPRTNLVDSEIGDIDGVTSSTSQVEPSTDLGFSQFMDVKVDAPGVEPLISSTEDVGLPCTDLVFPANGNVDDMITSSGQMEQEKTSTENVSSEIINYVEKNKKRHIKDKVSVQTKTEFSQVKSSSRKTPIAETQHKKAAARDLMEKKITVLQSLHLSIKFPASLNKNLNFKTFSKPKDRPIQQALPRVSSVNGVKKNSQVLPRPETKRSKPLLDCSNNGSKTTVLKSLSTSNSEASVASRKKPRSTTVFSSFSFKSDERAAKRKEKLEEKGNTNKTERTQLQPKLKEKGNRKLPWSSTVLEAKPSTSETKVPGNIIHKVPPKLGKKNFIEINKKTLSSSVACLPSKKLHDYSALMLKK